ncbi:MAG TPA: site-2 protease family protein, partial [Chthoniobacterales bacterium]
FSVILNVNLAILNMLPIPVLDGGHIVLAIIESIRRKPVNIRVLEFVQTGCAVLIIGYMAYVSFFDIGDLFGRDAETTRSAPAASSPAPAPER